jgi:AcrR family transcriptional regulator
MGGAEPLLGPARERILDAAERVTTEVGAGRLTLDAVSQAAAVSKGGLLYHFPNKDALLAALAQRYLDSLQQCVAAAKATLPADDPGRDLKAQVLGMLGTDQRSKAMVAALLAAAANDPTLLDGIRDRLTEHSRELAASNVGFARAAVIALAIDGLKTREALRVSTFTAQQRQQIVDELLDMTRMEDSR